MPKTSSLVDCERFAENIAAAGGAIPAALGHLLSTADLLRRPSLDISPGRVFGGWCGMRSVSPAQAVSGPGAGSADSPGPSRGVVVDGSGGAERVPAAVDEVVPGPVAWES